MLVFPLSPVSFILLFHYVATFHKLHDGGVLSYAVKGDASQYDSEEETCAGSSAETPLSCRYSTKAVRL